VVEPSADAAPVFAALGDPTRLALLRTLSREGPGSIARLSAGSTLTRQAITKHLEVLAEVGLVRDERRGRERIWAFERDRLGAAQRWLDALSADWDVALDRLRERVEGP
jgi:DNA-binding transcriptional ArsR family regulator